MQQTRMILTIAMRSTFGLSTTAFLSCLAACGIDVPLGIPDMQAPPIAWDLKYPAELPDAVWPACSATTSRALVDGTIPGGPFAGRWAYVFYYGGDCGNEANILITEQPLPDADAGIPDGGIFPRRMIGTSPPDDPWADIGVRTWIGTQAFQARGIAQVLHWASGDSYKESENYYEVVFAVDQPGWKLSGWYCATHYQGLDSLCAGP